MTHSYPGPLLLTPGPLTTDRRTREAMLRDWGSRDGGFIEMNARVRRGLIEVAGGVGSHTAILMQGSGTFAVEAMIGTFVPRDGKLLAVINGAYGRRIVQMCKIMGRACEVYQSPETAVPDPMEIDRRLGADPSIGHVVVVHCETTSGIVNPVPAIAETIRRHGRRLLVDAMSAFGALPLDARDIGYDALAASANKCLEGVPGFGFVIARQAALAATAGNAHSLSLDLHDQWQAMERNGQWRFTPPTHVLAAFDTALALHAAEGGVRGRGARYAENCKILTAGMRALGFQTLLPDALQAPIIVTFRMPKDPRFAFDTFYDLLRDKGYVIYPGKVAETPSFRIGCIGALSPSDMKGALEAIRATLAEMDVTDGAPASVREAAA
ncbi:MAG: 2-aminoethylphosphonate--pyruvate transaminase [Alphaproteobacteria bacterium]